MTKAEKQAKYGPKREALVQRLKLLGDKAKRITDKTAAAAAELKAVEAKLAEGDDAPAAPKEAAKETPKA